MKKLIVILIVGYLFVGCNNSTESQELDCNGEVSKNVELWGNCYNISETDTLNLAQNELTGEIPPEIGNLTNLTYLNLNNNQLTGEIPPEIGQLTNLTQLWLVSNQLRGVIPVEICNQGDNTLELINNQLCPPYPDCGDGEITDEYEQNTSNCEYCIENPTDPSCNYPL